VPLAISAVVAAAALLLPSWALHTVDIRTEAAVPQPIVRALSSLEGSHPMTVDLQWVRNAVSRWPGVAAVEVRLEPSGVLRIRAQDAPVVASLAIGEGWHGVQPDGRLGPQLAGPAEVSLVGLPSEPTVLRKALTAVDRVQPHIAHHRLRVTSSLPNTFSVQLLTADATPTLTLELRTRATAAERMWLDMVASGRLEPVGWVDLRGERRLVLRADGRDAAPPVAAATEGTA
jgi:hypothetical protein